MPYLAVVEHIQMEINPYKNLGPLFLDDNFDTVESKLDSNEYSRGERNELGIKKLSIYIPKLKTYIIFKERVESIDVIETKNENVTFNGQALINQEFKSLKTLFEKIDNNLIIEDDGFRSDKVGVGVFGDLIDGESTSRATNVVFYSKGHYDSGVTPDDIIKHYLGEA